MKTHESVVMYAGDYVVLGKGEVNARLGLLSSKLASLKGIPHIDEVVYWRNPTPGRAYFVPVFTLEKPEADSLGIQTADDLYGGVVRQSHQKTKSIVHGLVTPDAPAPIG